jgi:hypothetical protein
VGLHGLLQGKLCFILFREFYFLKNKSQDSSGNYYYHDSEKLYTSLKVVRCEERTASIITVEVQVEEETRAKQAMSANVLLIHYRMF